MYFIKTENTESGSVEVHWLASSSAYSKFDIEKRTAFNTYRAGDGIFTVDNGDLYFIQIKNTVSGYVEVDMADHQNNFAVKSEHLKTYFPLDHNLNGSFTIRGGYLYYIQTRNSPDGHVRVFLADKLEQPLEDYALYQT